MIFPGRFSLLSVGIHGLFGVVLSAAGPSKADRLSPGEIEIEIQPPARSGGGESFLARVGVELPAAPHAAAELASVKGVDVAAAVAAAAPSPSAEPVEAPPQPSASAAATPTSSNPAAAPSGPPGGGGGVGGGGAPGASAGGGANGSPGWGMEGGSGRGSGSGEWGGGSGGGSGGGRGGGGGGGGSSSVASFPMILPALYANPAPIPSEPPPQNANPANPTNPTNPSEVPDGFQPPSDCPPGQQKCGAECVDIQKDINNCGTCGNRCDQAKSEKCLSAACIGDEPLFQVNQITLPTQPGEFSEDLNGDGVGDNHFRNFIVTIDANVTAFGQKDLNAQLSDLLSFKVLGIFLKIPEKGASGQATLIQTTSSPEGKQVVDVGVPGTVFQIVRQGQTIEARPPFGPFPPFFPLRIAAPNLAKAPMIFPFRCHHLVVDIEDAGDTEVLHGRLFGSISKKEMTTIFLPSLIGYLGAVSNPANAAAVDQNAAKTLALVRTMIGPRYPVDPQGREYCIEYDGQRSLRSPDRNAPLAGCELDLFLRNAPYAPMKNPGPDPDLQVYQKGAYLPYIGRDPPKKDSISFGLGFEARRRKKGM